MANEVVGAADYELSTDLSGLKAGLKEADTLVQTEGKKTEEVFQKAGLNAGHLLGTGIKEGAKVLLTGTAAALAVATRGVVELEDVTASYRAETGATEEAAKAAGLAINRMAGRNLQPMQEIGSVMSAVTTKMNQTGDAANATTQDFLTFATATKQDAVGAVGDFDDILDGFNITASETKPIMDALVASHQKYGGSVTENQAALARMAPQLKALNLTWRDGIEILNLFASSGLDAAAGQRALNTAIGNMPPGKTFNDIVKEISAIEDPARRAARATEIFGAMAGPKMANAIKPGMASLDEYGFTVEEVAGKSEEAADAINGTFTNQIQLKIKAATTALTEFGSAFGPALTGMASIVSLAGALGLDTVVKKFGPQFAAAMKEVAGKGGDAFMDALEQTGIGATGTVIGNRIADGLATAWDKSTDSFLGQIARSAGAKIGVIWGLAVAGAAKLGELMSGVLLNLGANPATIAAATTAGTALGTAVMLGMAAGAIAAPLAVGRSIKDGLDKQAAELTEQTKSFAQTTTIEGLTQARDGIKQQLDSMNFAGIPWDAFGARDDLQAQIDILEGEIKTRSTHLATTAVDGIRDGLEKGKPAIAGSANSVFRAIPEELLFNLEVARHSAYEHGLDAGRDALGGITEGIKASRQKPLDAFHDLIDALKHEMSPAAEASRLIGELTGKNMAKGLKSKDPAVHAQAEYTKSLVLDRLKEMGDKAIPLTKKTAAFIERGLKSKDPEIRAAAQHYKDVVTGKLSEVPPIAGQWGSKAGSAFAKRMSAQDWKVEAAAEHLAQVASKYLRVSSPSELGPFSEGGGPGGWGERAGELFAEGMVKGMDPRMVDAAAQKVSDALQVPAGSWAARSVVEMGRSAITPDEADAAARAISGPREGGYAGSPDGPAGQIVLAPVYQPILGTATRAQLAQAASELGAALTNELVQRGIIPRPSARIV